MTPTTLLEYTHTHSELKKTTGYIPHSFLLMLSSSDLLHHVLISSILQLNELHVLTIPQRTLHPLHPHEYASYLVTVSMTTIIMLGPQINTNQQIC